MTIVTWLLGLAFSIQANNEPVAGAWQRTDQNGTQVLLIRDNYFSLTEYNLAEKKFLKTTGGVFRLNQGKASLVVEFDSDNKDAIGRKDEIPFVVDGDKLQFSFAGYGGEWKQVDNGQAPLAGNWRISGRMEEGQMNPIPKRDRKTLKLLTGNRFQWFAINPATREFFGTGGGTYRFENGKYVETIEFFSRDGSRVGASLEFDGRVDGDYWYHSGKSSKGDPLNEVWSREKDQ
ncbi:MAG: hypothetical protein ACK4E0_03450 [Chitinophagaceae bacterium]